MIEVFNNNVDKALRELYRYIQGVVSEVKERTHHVKPCQQRAEKSRKAVETRMKNESRAKRRPRNTLSIFNQHF